MGLVDDVVRVFEERVPRVLDGYELRTSQLEMACAVASSIETDGVSVIEAETGLGKSLAYLVPVILHCNGGNARAVVSTYTKPLQRQLAQKDFAAAASACGVEWSPAVLMGRAAYTCRRGVERVLARGVDDPDREAWLRELLSAPEGDIENRPGAATFLDARNAADLTCPSNEALCRSCRMRADCHLFAARSAALQSPVVITNHALLFSDAAADGALLGPFDTLVCDEAHHLEGVATSFLTVGVSPRIVRGARESVFTPDLEEVSAYARSRVTAVDEAEGDELDGAWSALRDAVQDGDGAVQRLFETLSAHAAKLGRGGEERDVIYAEGAPLLYGSAETVDEVRGHVEAVARRASQMSAIVERNLENGETDVAGSFRMLAERASEASAALEFVAGGRDETYVYFASHNTAGRVTALSASPIDVGAQLAALLDCASVTLTSATLAVGESFAYTLERNGLAGDDRVETHRYGTPFDLEANRRVIVAHAVPAPASREFTDAAVEVIASVSRLGRRMLVLATSKRQAAALSRRLARVPDLIVHTQTEGGARGDLLERFKSTGGVLVGLASFWEGVDLPGELLEVVCVLKLPFLVPTAPVVAARSQRLAAVGEDPFETLFVPDVVLRLRQGMGRLIRTGSDRGAVILLDRRLVTAPYGPTVLDAIADDVVRCNSTGEIAAAVAALFDGSR